MKKMKKLVFLIVIILVCGVQSNAQENKDEHLLEGTSMNYYYQNGTAVHVEFLNGQFKYKWIAGPNTGNEGQHNYRSRKIGDKMYLVNFHEETNSTFVTIVFNFNQNVISTSAIVAPTSDQETIIFEGGIIENLHLKEN